MKPVFRIAFSVAVLTSLAQPAQAQFWKKLFGGDRKRPARTAPKPVVKPAAPRPEAKKKEYTYPPTRMQQRYRIDVFAPLYLAEIVPGGKPLALNHLPERALQGVQFYTGLKLAADTLGDSYTIDLYIHDATDVEQSPSVLLSRKALEGTDLIIGALASSQLTGLASFAAKHSVNFVSVLSPSDAGIRDNPFFVQLQPTLQTHCEAIRQAALEGPKRKPLLLYRSTVTTDASARRTLLGDGHEASFSELQCNELPSTAQWRAALDTTGTNRIVVAVLDLAYAERLVQSMLAAAPRARFDVYVMPTWRGAPALRRPDAFPNAAINLTAPFNFDAETAAGDGFAKTYARTYGIQPGELAFRGYEVFQWLAYLLNRYGTVFNPKMGDSGAAGFTRFDVKLRTDKAGKVLYCENRNLYHYRFTNGSYTVN